MDDILARCKVDAGKANRSGGVDEIY